MALRGWSPEEWSKRAGIASTTLTRAMRNSYDGVTSVLVLDKLARCAAVPSPLDALRTNAIVVEVPDKPEEFVAIAYEDADPGLQSFVVSRIRQILETESP